jgi:hypothetical protein
MVQTSESIIITWNNRKVTYLWTKRIAFNKYRNQILISLSSLKINNKITLKQKISSTLYGFFVFGFGVSRCCPWCHLMHVVLFMASASVKSFSCICKKYMIQINKIELTKYFVWNLFLLYGIHFVRLHYLIFVVISWYFH